MQGTRKPVIDVIYQSSGLVDDVRLKYELACKEKEEDTCSVNRT